MATMESWNSMIMGIPSPENQVSIVFGNLLNVRLHDTLPLVPNTFVSTPNTVEVLVAIMVLVSN